MSNQLTRRKFLKTAAIGAVGVAVFPQFVTSCQNKKAGEVAARPALRQDPRLRFRTSVPIIFGAESLDQ